MSICSTSDSIETLEADVLVLGVFEEQELSGVAAQVNEASSNTLAGLIESGHIKSKSGSCTAWLAPNGVSFERVFVVGLGKSDELERGGAYKAFATASKEIAADADQSVVFAVDQLSAECVESAVTGVQIGCHGQDLLRKEIRLNSLANQTWLTAHADAVESGTILGEATNTCRDLVNGPAGHVYPESFAERAQEVATDANFEIEVWDEQRLKSEGCGSLLAVAQGSVRPPRLLIMRYRGSDAPNPQMAVIGKGVTFDSGGLSLKSSDGMKTMKCDMAGAATTLATMQAISKLGLSCHVIGLVGLVENMVSGNSYKLGDVLTARSGKTIEVLNTDAEGRLVLADVLNVADELNPDHMVDLATLTGACVVALGLDVVGVMTNDQDWADTILNNAATVGERAWQLPMFPEFAEQLKSKLADVKNIGEGRWGGAITAGKFLEEFVEDRSWVHLDIAGPAFADSAKSWIDGGASGVMVRTLVEVARGL